MATLVCDQCNGIDFREENGYFVCNHCGAIKVPEKNGNNIEESIISEPLIFKPAFSKKEFMRKALIWLSEHDEVPADIFDTEFEVSKHCIYGQIVWGDVHVSGSAMIGHDRIETYVTTESHYDRETNKNVQELVEHQRTVTDWTSASKAEDYEQWVIFRDSADRLDMPYWFEKHFEKCVRDMFDDKDTALCKSCSFESEEWNDIIIDPQKLTLADEDRVFAENFLKTEGKDLLEMTFNGIGDHMKGYTATATCDLTQVIPVAVPMYMISVNYKNEKYQVFCFPAGTDLLISGDTTCEFDKIAIHKADGKIDDVKETGFMKTIPFAILSAAASLFSIITAHNFMWSLGSNYGKIVSLLPPFFAIAVSVVCFLLWQLFRMKKIKSINKFNADLINNVLEKNKKLVIDNQNLKINKLKDIFTKSGIDQLNSDETKTIQTNLSEYRSLERTLKAGIKK